jgi:two-component system nitrate/nitrite response regulator NarL
VAIEQMAYSSCVQVRSASSVGRLSELGIVPEAIRVLIVHPNRLFRESLALAASQETTLRVVGVAADADELRPHLPELAPDVIVIDLGSPGREGLTQARIMSDSCPLAAILMIAVSELESDIVACCEAGATGYLTRDASLNDLLDHVRSAAVGETPCSPKVAAFLFSRLRQRARELQRLQTLGPIRLTRRELEIIALVEERLSNKEIACHLNIEVQTVKNHVHNILEKLELDGRHAAVRYARERGLLPLSLGLPRAPDARGVSRDAVAASRAAAAGARSPRSA